MSTWAVRAEGKDGRRLNPRKAVLRRWRESFAERLRERGVEAEASPQIARGGHRRTERLWQRKARDRGRDRAGGGAPGGGVELLTGHQFYGRFRLVCCLERKVGRP